FFFSSRRRHTRSYGDWSSDVCSSDLARLRPLPQLSEGWGGWKVRVRFRQPHSNREMRVRSSPGPLTLVAVSGCTVVGLVGHLMIFCYIQGATGYSLYKDLMIANSLNKAPAPPSFRTGDERLVK